jgi:hypothetical protein
VQARVPGLVRPPSLVSSAVEMLVLLHIETHDMPRAGLCWSSTGELTLEVDCRAVVKSDSFRSMRGFDLEKEACEEWRMVKGEGRGARPGSGGSSTSAGSSSSAVMDRGSVLGVFCMMEAAGAPVLPK